ncbi:MAG TPA: Holliday junction branch migration protein RuvA [Verrucomicrobiae bacterium]|nr:Holliday junction branch migration protein RuvA [Verrucomicrobiae bacterium]
MIARLSGTLLEKNPGLLVLDVAGVGYEVTIPLGTFRVLGEPGARVELHVHTHVREDTLALFGFATRLEKELFVRLLAVNGVGPKTAVALLSGLGAEPLVEAVRRRDIRRLSGAPGIGRKTAERIALDLADRLESLAAPDRRDAAPGGMKEDLVSALVNLGYNARAASEAAAGALDGAPSEPPFEDLLRRALRTLSR